MNRSSINYAVEAFIEYLEESAAFLHWLNVHLLMQRVRNVVKGKAILRPPLNDIRVMNVKSTAFGMKEMFWHIYAP